MADGLHIKDWTTVFQNAEEVDLPAGAMAVCRNFRPVNGKLEKTQGVGVKLDSTIDGVRNLVTYIDSNLSGGELYIAVKIDGTTKVVTLYSWSGSAWQTIQNALGNFTGNGSSWYAAADKNPIIQVNDTLRFLPGAVGQPYLSNEAKGIWLGRIDRLFFDSLYDVSGVNAGFYNYACNVEKPSDSLIASVVQFSGDEAFSPTEGGLAITNLSTADDTVTIAGEYPAAFRSGTLFEIEDNTTNYGTYKVEYSSVESGQTVIKIDISYKDFAGTQKMGNVRVTTERDTRYYKFAYVYDGVQEGLLSEATRVKFGDQKFPGFSLAITKADHNKRITALKVYRSVNGLEGTYRHVLTVDFLRKSGEYESGSGSAYTGLRTVYIPGLNGTTTGDSPAGTGKIKLWNSNYHDWSEYTTDSYGESSTRVLFGVSADVDDDDYWDCAWEYYADGATLTDSGTSGAFAGKKVVVVGESLGDLNYAGGVLTINSSTPSTPNTRMISDSHERAVHLTAPLESDWSNKSWWLIKPDDGLYFAYEYGASNEFVGYWVFDTGLSDGAAPPLEGEKSIRVNGQHAAVCGNRLWLGNVVLDPGDKEEKHVRGGAYSELDQYDVIPVSNLWRFPDREGGNCSGVANLAGNPLYLFPRGMTLINTTSDPSTPANWKVSDSPHNIGNVADDGYVEVLGSVYMTYWDGFYRVRANNLAPSDETPTEQLKISGPIDNIFNAMTETQKQAVRTEYNQRRGEVVFAFTYTVDSTDYDVAFCYNVRTGAWRETYTDKNFDLMALDEHADVMVYDDTINKVCSLAESDSAARASVRIPYRMLSTKRTRPLRWIHLTYVSASDLKLYVYTEDAPDTAAATITVPASATWAHKVFRPRVRGNIAAVEISEDHADYLASETTPETASYLIAAKGGGVNPNTKIGELQLIPG